MAISIEKKSTFPHPCIVQPAEGVSLGIRYRRSGTKTRVTVYQAEKEVWRLYTKYLQLMFVFVCSCSTHSVSKCNRDADKQQNWCISCTVSGPRWGRKERGLKKPTVLQASTDSVADIYHVADLSNDRDVEDD